MGALHDGHAALMRAARAACDTVVASIFVNPMQFGPTEDLSRYPRTLDADLERCAIEGVDVVWAPEVTDIYPDGPAQVHVVPGPLGAVLEGASRPTHFTGVLTVVHKLFSATRPDVAYFGQKDYQQLCLVQRMVADLDLGVSVVGVPTVRESDGLALSSRNRYLSADERERALALSRALFAGRAAAAHGVAAVLDAARAVLTATQGMEVDYLELRTPDLLTAAERGPARLLVAARVGATRLIDNMEVAL
jgi:pantoate--beta-alanine ligase